MTTRRLPKELRQMHTWLESAVEANTEVLRLVEGVRAKIAGVGCLGADVGADLERAVFILKNGRI